MRDQSTSQSDSPGRHASAYWFIDGLPEIVFGVAYLVLGFLGTVWGVYLPNPWMKSALVIAWLAFLVLFYMDRRLLDFFKARVTYPRTGYVRPPRDPSDRRDELLTIGSAPSYDENVSSYRIHTVFLIFMPLAIIDIMNTRWTVAPVMIAVAALLYFWNRNEPHRYHFWTIVPVALAGIAAAFLDAPQKSRPFVPLLIGGAWLLAQGAFTLIRYLHTHPRAKVLRSE